MNQARQELEKVSLSGWVQSFPTVRFDRLNKFFIHAAECPKYSRGGLAEIEKTATNALNGWERNSGRAAADWANCALSSLIITMNACSLINAILPANLILCILPDS